VAVIETMTFRLRSGVDDAEFLRIDKRLQSEFAYQQPGLVRRTTACGDGGTWIVIDVWATAGDADAMSARWDTDALAAEFMSHVDADTVEVRRYTTPPLDY
jgi:hypothetical protein